MLKKCIAEFLGTLFFLFVVLVTGKVVPIGLALMVSIYLLNAYTSGMFNLSSPCLGEGALSDPNHSDNVVISGDWPDYTELPEKK